MIGTTLHNRYRLESELGQGGIGTVYRAYDMLLVQEAPILPVTHGRQHYLLKPRVKRYSISPLQASYWKDVIIEAH